MKSNWSPVVYGRTHAADFRFLALPAGGAAGAWAEPYILASMSVAEQLPDAPRWLLAQTTEQRLVGVTCMARDLVGRDDPQTRDAQGRPLYLFVGYLTARLPDGGFAPGPAYPAQADLAPQQALAPFASLYQYVHAHWNEQIPKAPEQVAASALSFDKGNGAKAEKVEGAEGWAFNTERAIRALWPDGPKERQWLWAQAQRQTASGECSLCLGLARQRDALDSAFLNATITGLTAPTRVEVGAPQQAQTKSAQTERGATEARRNESGMLPVLVIRALYDDRWLRSFFDTMRQRGYHIELGSQQRDESSSLFSRLNDSGAGKLIYLFTDRYPRLLLDLDPGAAKARMQREGLPEPQKPPLEAVEMSGGSAAHAAADILEYYLPQTGPLDAMRDGFGGFIKGLRTPPNKGPRRDR